MLGRRMVNSPDFNLLMSLAGRKFTFHIAAAVYAPDRAARCYKTNPGTEVANAHDHAGSIPH